MDHPAFQARSGLSDWARGVLGRRVYAVLATVNRDGSPHIVPVGFAFDGGRLLIPTVSGSKMVRNVEADARARVLVQAPGVTTGVDGWVAADGRAHVVRGAEVGDLRRFAEGRYLTEAGKRAYDAALAPAMDAVIVVDPARWTTWISSDVYASLRAQGYREEEIGGWFLPLDP
jgi:PPOX class probable F420-dependent enzyme